MSFFFPHHVANDMQLKIYISLGFSPRFMWKIMTIVFVCLIKISKNLALKRNIVPLVLKEKGVSKLLRHFK